MIKHHEPKSIQRVIGGFEAGVACLQIPVDSVTLALRFYNNPMPEIGVVLLVPTETNDLETYRRTFLLWPEDHELPISFQKYIATFPFGGQITHVIEIEVI